VGRVPGYFDATGPGDFLAESFRVRGTAMQPVVYSSQRKQDLMDGLAVAIQRRKIAYPDGVIRTELESFEYALKGRRVTFDAPSGSHDDAVNALALAWSAACDFRAMHVERRTGGGGGSRGVSSSGGWGGGVVI
jgi:hypothetical protein